MKRVNGYLREEFPGELDSLRKESVVLEKGETNIQDLKNQGFSDFEINKLRIESE